MFLPRIMPVFGKAAGGVSPPLGHLHVTDEMDGKVPVSARVKRKPHLYRREALETVLL